jgi:hypothetical protein
VISIRAFSGNRQEQIDFGRRENDHYKKIEYVIVGATGAVAPDLGFGW